jgi:hypothetical protein
MIACLTIQKVRYKESRHKKHILNGASFELGIESGI